MSKLEYRVSVNCFGKNIPVDINLLHDTRGKRLCVSCLHENI